MRRVAQKLIYGSIIIVLVSLVIKLWLFDMIVRFAIKDQTCLRKRNEIRDIYLKIPFPLDFKIYFFNVTNPMEIQNGAMPIVKEVGPYWYDEFKEKIDVVDNDMEDSLTYTPYDIFKFNQNKSGTLTEDDYVTVVHPLIVGMVNQVMQDSPVFISIISQAIPILFNYPTSIFLTTKVKDILFDGVEVNCKGKDFSSNAVCGQLKSKIPGLKFKEGDEKVYLLALLASRNATKTSRVKILRGINNAKDLGKLIEFDGKKEINLWSTKECNRFEGTDGWIFPALSTPEEGIKSFSTDLCRNIKVNYINDTIYKKIKVGIYETTLGDQMHDEDQKCYCRTPDTCLKKGLLDLSKCLGVPIIATLPHFLHTDESYLGEIRGLEPDVDKHGLRVLFERMTGCPLKAAKRMQFNFDLQANKKVPLFANLPSALFPLLWIEEGADLEGPILKKLQRSFLLLDIADVLLYLPIVFGIISVVVAAYFYQKNRKEVSITPVYEIKKKIENGVKADDMKNLTEKSEPGGDKSPAKPVMSGREFDRY
nr:sensory neuron membrane protein 1b [Pachyrhinus yasumatsui]